jgi:NADH-quinone oxidoreductase subunit G
VVATERPTALDGGAEAIARYAPGQAAHFVGELASAIGGSDTVATPVAETLRDAGKVVVIWGERIAREDGAAEALLDVAKATKMATTEEAGLLEIPDTTNARGLREAGVLPDAGPGLADTTAGLSTEEIREALISGELTGLVLFGADPLRDFPDTPAWEEALTAADFVVTFSMHENATTAKSDVVLPLETHAEKDGTVTHPDGRLQRVRPSASRPENVLPNIIVLSELAEKLGLATGIDSQPTAFQALTNAVSFYNGIEDEQVGGRGLRWQDREGATSAREGTEQPGPGGPPEGGSPDTQREAPISMVQPDPTPRRVASADPPSGGPSTATNGNLLLGTYRDLWAGPITELNPPLKFLTPRQRVELSKEDAERLDLKSGDQVRVSHDGSTVEAQVQIKERVPAGVVFMAEGVAGSNANALLNGGPVSVEIEKLSEASA